MRLVGRRTSSTRLPVLLLLGLTVLGAAAAGAAPPAADVEDLLWDLQILPLDGAPPPLSLEAVDGKRWSLADLRGRPVLLYFWEST